MKNNITFVLWSGGLDSTYLIQKLLDEDKNRIVWSGYVELLNNGSKSTAEIRARLKLSPILNRLYGDRFVDLGTIHRVEVTLHNHWSPLVQMPIWFNALITSVPKEVGEVCLGYVMNDCAISYLDEMRAMFKCFSKHFCEKPFPKVTFPLSKIPKEEIYHNLNRDLREHVVWCETPVVEYKLGEKESPSITPCGHCVPCEHSPIMKSNRLCVAVKEKEFVETFNKSSEPIQKEFEFV